MVWVDWFLLTALLVSILIGVWRGFTREILGLATWVVALLAAFLLSPVAEAQLHSHIAVESVRRAAAYGIVFFIALLLGGVVTHVLSTLVRKSPLSGLDRTVGGGFGLIRGVLLAVIVVWLVGLTPARQDTWWKQSMFVGRLEWLAQGFQHVVPPDWRDHMKAATVVTKEGV